MALTVHPSLFKDYPDISDFENASRFLQALRMSMKLEDAPPSFLSTKCIQQLLRENPMYYVNLERRHARALLCPNPSKPAWRGSRYLTTIESYLERLRHGSDTFCNPTASSFWAPSSYNFSAKYSFRYADHIQSLEIPRLVNTSEPVLLLHDFGTFSNNATLNHRIARIYQNNTNSFFVNGSASGKTRLLLEGLHQNWGFYFTAAVDSSKLGSNDISTMMIDFEMEGVFNRILPPKEDPTFEICLDLNARFTYRYFSVVLLARLVVFKRFLEAASGKPDDGMRHRWLLAQLHPRLLQLSNGPKRDPFDELRDIMQEWQSAKPLDSIFSLFPTTPGTPLFIVIDEGNVLADGGKYTFSDAFGDGRPILKELLTTWQHHVQAYDVTFIVAGTEIPRKHFQGDQWSNYQWSSDSGDFGTPELHRQYVSKFLPPSIASSPSGEELQLRMWRWFRGRHRFTASVISQLLATDFQSPHRLLDFLVWLSTGYEPRDGEAYSRAEESRDFERRYLPMKMPDPKHYPSVKAAVHDALIHCLVTLDHRLVFGIDRVDAVSRGVGRFIDANMEQIVIDEPLCLVTCAQWFADKKRSLTDIDFYLSADTSYQCPLSAACFVALCLAHVFSQPRAVADVLSFPGTRPDWANQTASLVDFASTNSGEEIGISKYTSGTSRRLASVAETQADTLAWLKDEHRSVFCIHSASSTSPTLLFSLKLADESLLWLFLHVHLDGKTEELVPEAELQDMLEALQPENLFDQLADERTGIDGSLPTDVAPPPSTAKSDSSDPPKKSEAPDDFLKLLEGLPNRNQGVGAYSVLRVVASLRADAKLDHLDVNPDHPIAELNTRFVQSITEKFSAKDILEDVVANTTYVEGYTGVKRKSTDDRPTLKRRRSASSFIGSVQEVDV
ncbi:uncharacterized protein EV420DRAFT_1638358 [Desarmillaria tabescens]|uniref:Uncharacterized protein n=1 Tax=Armillaria tabescens TaxID=1929756 RepID=A0AA39NFQ8_ARMTA|nr:uncharacterized protein EV420DRAFT_1638358 [Desarmillaria tabescens]KAK0464793.1 hypothetical protein EV420DRAFT_1638358 [Desarmillaria tabescens]